MFLLSSPWFVNTDHRFPHIHSHNHPRGRASHVAARKTRKKERRIVDGSDNTGKYSRWHRPSILFSSSINWGKRSPHFRYDSPFGEEEKITASRAREGLARANAHLVHLRRVSPFDVNLRTYRDESRVSHANERTRIHTSTLRHLCRSPRVIVVVSPFAVSLRR